ncbi:MAG: hypothetical protein J0M12_11790, partial [Deltaproteobacteria bacterium]|nr:hypothetical protein [Deltaproteobacteria bacterium]
PSAGPLYLLLLDNLSWTDEQGRQVTISEEVVKMLEKEGFALKLKKPFKRVWIMEFEKENPRVDT